MKIKLRTVLIVFAALVMMVVAYVLMPKAEEEVTEAANTSEVNYDKLDEVVFDVETDEIKTGDLVKRINANGIAKAEKAIDVIANITGSINRINAFEGKLVSQNQEILVLDDNEYKLALEEAESKLSDAKVEYGLMMKDWNASSVDENKIKQIKQKISEIEDAWKNKKISETDYLNKKQQLEVELMLNGHNRESVVANKSGLTSALNQYKRSKLNYAYTKISAPFAGVIADLDLSNGARVSAGSKICQLLDISRMKIDVGVLENDISSIATGNSAVIEFTAIKGQKFNGRVVSISPVINPDTKTCKVTVEVINKNNLVKPGMYANVEIQSSVLKNRLLIPKRALLVRDNRNLIFCVEGDLAKWQYIEIGEQNDEFIEVVSGAEAGQQVIVEGHYTLAHDAKIKILK